MLHVVVPGPPVCLCVFSMFVNGPTIPELFLEWETKNIFFYTKNQNKMTQLTYLISRISVLFFFNKAIVAAVLLSGIV